MTNSNWMVVLANSYRKALKEQYNVPIATIDMMDLKEMETELKGNGYDFKHNSPFKNK